MLRWAHFLFSGEKFRMENEILEANSTDEQTVKEKKCIWPIVEGIIITIILSYFDADSIVIVLLWIANIVFLLEDRIKTRSLNITF